MSPLHLLILLSSILSDSVGWSSYPPLMDISPSNPSDSYDNHTHHNNTYICLYTCEKARLNYIYGFKLQALQIIQLQLDVVTDMCRDYCLSQLAHILCKENITLRQSSDEITYNTTEYDVTVSLDQSDIVSLTEVCPRCVDSLIHNSEADRVDVQLVPPSGSSLCTQCTYKMYEDASDCTTAIMPSLTSPMDCLVEGYPLSLVEEGFRRSLQCRETDYRHFKVAVPVVDPRAMSHEDGFWPPRLRIGFFSGLRCDSSEFDRIRITASMIDSKFFSVYLLCRGRNRHDGSTPELGLQSHSDKSESRLCDSVVNILKDNADAVVNLKLDVLVVIVAGMKETGIESYGDCPKMRSIAPSFARRSAIYIPHPIDPTVLYQQPVVGIFDYVFSPEKVVVKIDVNSECNNNTAFQYDYSLDMHVFSVRDLESRAQVAAPLRKTQPTILSSRYLHSLLPPVKPYSMRDILSISFRTEDGHSISDLDQCGTSWSGHPPLSVLLRCIGKEKSLRKDNYWSDIATPCIRVSKPSFLVRAASSFVLRSVVKALRKRDAACLIVVYADFHLTGIDRKLLNVCSNESDLFDDCTYILNSENLSYRMRATVFSSADVIIHIPDTRVQITDTTVYDIHEMLSSGTAVLSLQMESETRTVHTHGLYEMLGLQSSKFIAANVNDVVCMAYNVAVNASEKELHRRAVADILSNKDSLRVNLAWKKLLLFAALTPLHRQFTIGGHYSVVDIEKVGLLSPREFFPSHPVDVYSRQSYGWERIHYSYDIPLDDYNFLVLRIPAAYLHQVACDENIQGGWVVSAEKRFSNSTFTGFSRSLAFNEIAGFNQQPIESHTDLQYTKSFTSYSAHSTMVLQIWKEDDWKRCVIAMTEYMERIDRFYIGTLVGRWMARDKFPVTSQHQYTFVTQPSDNVHWRPGIGSLDYVVSLRDGPLIPEVVAVDHLNSRMLLYVNESWDTGGFEISYSNLQLEFPVLLLEGDDPGQVQEWYQMKYGWDDEFKLSLSKQLIMAGVNEDFVGSKTALQLRREGMILFSFPTGNSSMRTALSGGDPDSSSLFDDVGELTCSEDTSREIHDSRMAFAADPTSEADNSISIVLTTCRRLSHFIRVASSLHSLLETFPSDFVLQVVVVDDASSVDDRIRMLTMFESFTFLFKSSDSRGHASSLNLMMRIVTSRFLLYLEDDWLPLAVPLMDHDFASGLQARSDCSGNSYCSFYWILKAAVDVINNSLYGNSTTLEPVAQVLLNEQATSGCARGLLPIQYSNQDTDFILRQRLSLRCDVSVIGKGGWSRMAEAQSSCLNEGSIGNEDRIVYRIHEFGLAGGILAYDQRVHGHTVWPGLSLNPGVWDLAQMRYAFHSCFARNSIFDEQDEAFEHRFTLIGSIVGLNVAFFPIVSFIHTGEDISAYVLNNFSRPWQ